MLIVRDWMTLVMRLVGVGLLVYAIPASFHAVLGKIDLAMALAEMPGAGPRIGFFQWTRGLGSLVLLFLGAYFLFGGTWFIKHLFRGLVGKDRLCPHCGYDIRGIDAWRCPECGKAIGARGAKKNGEGGGSGHAT